MNRAEQAAQRPGEQEAHPLSLPSSCQLLWAGFLDLSPCLPTGEHRNSSLYVLIILIFKCQPWNSPAVRPVVRTQHSHCEGLGSILGQGTAAAAVAKSLQSCPTLCNPIDGSPPGSSVPGILQARTLGWVAISFSNA